MILTIKQLLLGVTGILPAWWFKMALGSFSISLCVNAAVTGLLVLKIVLLHRAFVKSGTRTRRLYDLRPLISILIESGMFTFVAQTIWVIFVRLQSDGNPGFSAVVTPTTMIYAGIFLSNVRIISLNVSQGLTPTIVLVRAAAGRSYDTTFVKSDLEFCDLRTQAESAVTNPNLGSRLKTENIVQSH